MDFLQVLLVAVVVVLTGLLGYIGVQVVLILKDFRKTLKRMDETVTWGEWMKRMGSKGGELPAEGGKEVERLVEMEERNGEKELFGGVDDRPEAGREIVPEHITTVRRRGREVAGKFFHKGGRPLVN